MSHEHALRGVGTVVFLNIWDKLVAKKEVKIVCLSISNIVFFIGWKGVIAESVLIRIGGIADAYEDARFNRIPLDEIIEFFGEIIEIPIAV